MIYTINGKNVGEKEFKNLLSDLKEIEGTWFCVETDKGGITGYESHDKEGIVYEYKAYSETDHQQQLIMRKENILE